jgi:hypothetical protein
MRMIVRRAGAHALKHPHADCDLFNALIVGKMWNQRHLGACCKDIGRVGPDARTIAADAGR